MLNEACAGSSANHPLVHAAAAAEADRPVLVVTIDTEEEGLWSGNYNKTGAVTNILGIPRFQQLCDRFNIRPTYLIDAPVVESTLAVSILKPLQDQGRAEIGAHLHPWNNPPKTEPTSQLNSFCCNLPESLQRAKLEWLTENIAARFGRRPTSFRAGRYGMGTAGINILRELGYRVDSSVIPFTNYRSEGGPDFSAVMPDPYFPDLGSIHHAGQDQSLLEMPVTVGFTHRYFESAQRLRVAAMQQPFRRLRAVGILDRLGIAKRVKLSPEQASFREMRALAQAIHARGTRSLVLMFHSSSLKPGCSPYVGTEAELDQFLQRLEHFFAYCLRELSYVPQSLSDCYEKRSFLTRTQ